MSFEEFDFFQNEFTILIIPIVLIKCEINVINNISWKKDQVRGEYKFPILKSEIRKCCQLPC